MKWVAIALALLLASGIFWLGRTSTISGTPSQTPAAKVEAPAKTAAPAAPAPQMQPSAPASAAAPMDAAPLDAAPAPDAPPQEPQAAPPPKPKTLAELDTGTLIQRAIRAEDGCSGGDGSLDQTGAACAMRDRIEAILNARGFCSSSGSANWQRCAQ